MKPFLKRIAERALVGLFKEDTIKDFNINNWQGKVSHNDLELSTSILDKFSIDLGFPVSISRGNIGQLMIQIPWKNILNENIIVKVKDLTLLASMDLTKLEDYRKQSLAYV